MAELLCHVDTAEGVSAAVQNGADAVAAWLAIPGQPGLTAEEFYGAAQFCRVRGVRLYADVDLAATDGTLEELVGNARTAWLNGADAVIAGDYGLILALRRALPDCPIFGGARLNVHSLDGVKAAAAVGIRRVLLAPEVRKDEIEAIRAASPIGLEVLVHGFTSPSLRGRSLLSALSGGPSENRGRGGREILKEFETEVKGVRPFILEDTCLVTHLGELGDLAAIGLDGTGRRPEYTAVLTGLYARARDGGRLPDEEEYRLLAAIEPVTGYSDHYYAGQTRFRLSAATEPKPEADSPFLNTVRKSYLRREFQRVPVRFTAEVGLGTPFRLFAEDDRGNTAIGEGGRTELAFHRELTQTSLQTELFKTGGTPFICEGIRCRIAKGVTMNPQDIALLRDRLLEELMEKRKYLAPRTAAPAELSLSRVPNPTEPPLLSVALTSASQLSDKLVELAPPQVYLPLGEIRRTDSRVLALIGTPGVSVAAVLPPLMRDEMKPRLTTELIAARQLGVEEVLVQSLAHAVFARQLGFRVRGGLGLNILSSAGVEAARAFGLASVTLSPELTSEEVSAITKALPAELTVYGRLPLVVSGGCLVRGVTGTCSCESFSGIPDRTGLLMPVTHTADCMSTVWSARKLHLKKRSREYMSAGLWAVRLQFTTENADECAAIAERYLDLGTYEPVAQTTGLF